MRASSVFTHHPAPPAWVEITRHNGLLTCLAAHGEFDLATLDALRLPLVRQLLSGCRAVALDMSDVGFVDVVAIEMLFATQQDFMAAGSTLLITNPSRQVARLLHLAGLDRRLIATQTAAFDC